jgi:hypothetical protein
MDLLLLSLFNYIFMNNLLLTRSFLSKLNLLNIASEFHIIIVDIQIVICTKYVDMSMISFCTKFHIPGFSSSLVIGIEPKVKEHFQIGVMFLFSCQCTVHN